MRRDEKCYYARFTELYCKKFRFETLIYLEDLREELGKPIGECIAAVVCKNPGSASEAYETASGAWAPIRSDNTLRTVRKIFLDACGNNVPSGAFVKVWNHFICATPTLVQHSHSSTRLVLTILRHVPARAALTILCGSLGASPIQRAILTRKDSER
jgi:hypothetical protein